MRRPKATLKAMSDYERIARAIKFILGGVESQPCLKEVAGHLHMSPFHFQRMFSKWAGISPKRFLQVLTLERAKQLLEESRTILEVTQSLGLSSGSRLHDHFVTIEAMTPGEYKSDGTDLSLKYGVHGTPFGQAFIAATNRGVCKLSFMDDSCVEAQLTGMKQKWPQAEILFEPDVTRAYAEAMFHKQESPALPIPVHVHGTNFQIKVWRALLDIPQGSVWSYARVAKAIGHGNAARAVGRAVGANPVGFLIPCHRVIRESGELAGYRWGETRKHVMHVWEAARKDA